MKSTRCVLPILGACALAALTASAAEMAYTFEGDGHNSATNLPLNFDGRTITGVTGIPATATITFDLAGTTDLAPADTSLGAYVIPNASLSVNVGFAGGSEVYSYTGDLQLYIYNNYTNPNGFPGVADAIVIVASGGIVNGNPGSSFDLQFFTLNTAAWGSDAASNVLGLQSAFGSIAGYDQQFRLFSGEPGEGQGLSFNAFSAGVTAVPEPGSFAAVGGLAALGFGAFRRRSRRN